MDYLNSPLSREEYREYQYLQYKFIFDKTKLNDKEQKRYDKLYEKYVKECERKERLRKWREEEEYKEEIFKLIKPKCKFVSKFVKGGISRQTGEYAAFYDIEIYEFPLLEIYDKNINNQINKYHKLRGYSQNLSMYACYKQELAENRYAQYYFLPAIEAAYKDYLDENFYGKEGFENGISCKKYQIDWFDEVFVADKKIHTRFQRWYDHLYKQIENRWKDLINTELQEPESWEKAWIDSIEYESKHQFYNFCCDLRKNPNDYEGIKNPKEYLQEASKIIGRKFI